MKETTVPLPVRVLPAAAAFTEAACASAGLVLARKDTLKKYPDSVHWHYRRAGESGTLEITLRSNPAEIRFKVQEGRRAAWIPAAQASIDQELRRRLGLSER
jgi:hypothetical protein